MKTVYVFKPGQAKETLQSLYLDRNSGQLVPNIAFVDESGDLLWQTNSFGLRGADVEPGQRMAVVWGDSFVFGAPQKGWPELIGELQSNCVFLNGGIEGDSLDNVLRRAVAFNRKNRVALNIVLPGWHPIFRNDFVRMHLENAAQEVPNLVLVTQPCSLNPTIITTDISKFFAQTATLDTYYGFWGAEPYSVALQGAYFKHICERNAIVYAVAAEFGLPLIDLYAALETSVLDDFRKHFFDLVHLRPSAYRIIASIIHAGIGTLLSKPVSA